MIKRKKVVKDFIYSFFSFALPTAVLVFCIQPAIALNLKANLNGKFLTMMAFIFFFTSISGGVLSTVRLLLDKEYKTLHIKGDFNIIFCIYIIIDFLLIPIIYISLYREYEFIDLFLVVAISVLYLYHDYTFCQYKLNLQFNKILINNIITIIGYALGYLIFIKTSKWQFVFIMAYFFGAIYDYFNTDFIKEPYSITANFYNTLRKVLNLTVSSAIGSIVVYYDKFVLFPIMGGDSVSVYSSATLVGKMIVMLSAPINSILLSYLIRIDTTILMIKKKYVIITLMILAFIYMVLLIIGYPLINLLYPLWAEESSKYIPYTAAQSVVLFFAELINVYILKIGNSNIQVVIQSFKIIVYVLTSIIGLYYYGIYGFCIGTLASSIMYLAFVILIMNIYIKKNISNNKISESKLID